MKARALAARARRGLKTPPREIAARLAAEARAEIERFTAPATARRLDLLAATGAASIEDLWQRLAARPSSPPRRRRIAWRSRSGRESSTQQRRRSRGGFLFVNQVIATPDEEWEVLRRLRRRFGAAHVIANPFGAGTLLHGYGYPRLKTALASQPARATVSYPGGSVVARRVFTSSSPAGVATDTEYSYGGVHSLHRLCNRAQGTPMS